MTRTHTTPLVGRELEKTLLVGTFERSAQQRSCQLVTIVGEPGVGKSRLCAELFALHRRAARARHLAPGPLPALRGGDRLLGAGGDRQGRVRHPRVGLARRGRGQARACRSRPTSPTGSGSWPGWPRSWVRPRSLPRRRSRSRPGGASWRRWPSQGPTVLVFEDLHWADDALLSFLEHLADWSQGVPLLVLCTARPELQEQHPTWAAGLRNATTINLAPLTDEETARLIASLLERAVLPAETQRALLERAGGNPLYAEEFVRLLADRGQLDEAVEVPDSVQALIAARLDTLSPRAQEPAPGRRRGRQGVLGGRAGRDGRSRPARGRAGAARARRARSSCAARRTSSMRDEAEYGFWHLLVRDVCYAQIPRAARAARHRAAAAWLERQAGERAEDLADVLAYHYLSALELVARRRPSRAGGGAGGERDPLPGAGRRARARARRRARRGEPGQGARARPRRPPRARLAARALGAGGAAAGPAPGDTSRARGGARPLPRAGRERRRRAGADRALERAADGWATRAQEETLGEALALLEAQPPGPELVAAYAELAGSRVVGGAYQGGDRGRRAGARARRRARPARAGPRARLPRHGPRLPGGTAGARGHAPGARARARAGSGPRRGRPAQQPRARHLAVRGAAGGTGCLPGGDRLLRAARHHRVRARDRRHEHDLPRRARPAPSRRWPKPCPLAERLEAAGDIASIEPRSLQLRLLAERGAHEHAPAADELLATARESGQPQDYALAFTAAARLLLAQGHRQQANALLVELAQVPEIHADPYYAAALPDARAHRARPPPAGARQPARRRRRAAHAPRRARAPRRPRPARRSRRASTPRPQPSTPRRPSAGASSGTSPSAPTPCSARAAAWPRSASPSAESRCARRASCSRRWATSRRSPRRMRCSSERPPPLRSGSFTKRVAPGGVEPPRADSKFLETACSEVVFGSVRCCEVLSVLSDFGSFGTRLGHGLSPMLPTTPTERGNHRPAREAIA